jgi:hypothetical protein
MLVRISSLLLFALIIVALALAYAYYDVKDISGVVRDAQGHPIANAALTLAGRSALSDEGGRFQIAISRGTYALIGYADGFTSAQQTLTADELLPKNFSADLILPLNEFTATVLATDLHGPIAGARVQVQRDTPSPGADLTLTTDARGEFVVRGIKNGMRLQVSALGYRPGSFFYEGPGPREFALSPALARVTIKDEYSRLPLPNITVTAGDQAAQTDAQGLVVFRALSGAVPITARAPGHEAAGVQYNGEADLTLTLRPDTLDGVVKEAATQKPLAHALIFYNGQMLETDARGGYHLEQAPPQLVLTVKTPGYRLTSFAITRTAHFDLELGPFKAKGIHIYYAMPRDAVVELIDRLRGTEINTIVLDVKEGAGDIVWPSQVPLAQQIGAYKVRGISPRELIDVCRARQLYCVARMVVFKDTRLGTARPDWALHYPGGEVLNAANEIWMNPAKQEVWDYDLALAKELSALGFDEVQLDYIRYPGRPMPLESGTAGSRVQTIKQFLETASEAMKPLPAFFSGDVFGLTTVVRDEQGIGQIYEEDAPYFDYISPMMYPSTWKGAPNLFQVGLGISACASPLACPYDIVYQGTLLARERARTLIRPWLQAYRDVGFGAPEFVLQRKGAEDSDSAGWLFWNNQGLYDVTTFETLGQ